MPLKPPSPSQRPVIEINGYAVRAIRQLAGIKSPDLASVVGCAASYIRRIETGNTTKVSPEMFASLRRALGIQDLDHRALLANPHAEIESAVA